MSPTTPSPSDPQENSRSREIERRLAVPVLVSALVSVPAVFLDLWGSGAWSTVGGAVTRLAGLLLWVEWAVLFASAENRRAWLRRHLWMTVVAAVTVPAVLFALGPAQVLRLLRIVGTLHLLRVTRIVQAGGMLRRRMGLTGRWGTAVTVTTTLLAAVFVTAILADPGSASRRVLDDTIDAYGWWPTAAAIALALGATAVVVLHRWARLRDLRSPGGRTSARSTGNPDPPEDGEPSEPGPQSSP
ncbi:metal-sensitive transcriptional repressor family protein [Nocardiopsis sp. FIRDI 009]|uniref:metal-sensitive transcriptional repressor family protein n=1 Tax=Nocardiopsis sp. FIRDI 009 TaxID=714197 RepID=UPI0018E545CD|nr:metal-sensitive transcriptional repressor family protein [Nocardiopsis sp. FIRDI 009]